MNDHKVWTGGLGRWRFFFHQYRPDYRVRFGVERHRSAENLPNGPTLVLHIFWRRWQLSIDRRRRAAVGRRVRAHYKTLRYIGMPRWYAVARALWEAV